MHIPFCQQACHYCDFHFSTSLKHKPDVLRALATEIKLQADYLNHAPIQTLYLGGGTPSLLSENDLHTLFEHLHTHFNIAPDAEISLEANPDDLQGDSLRAFQQVGINRLSIGVQSFEQNQLYLLNRSHDSKTAYHSIVEAQTVGFENISIDLIYGIPSQDHRIWEQDLEKAMELQVPHISAYCLTVEPHTVFGNWQKKGKFSLPPDDFVVHQFHLLLDTLEQNGFEHYEISNFARDHLYSRHNLNYWKKGSYLGLGPSAHSYNQLSRQFNVAHNPKYIQSLKEGKVPYEREILSNLDQINEYLMTSLRTQWGCNFDHIQKMYNLDLKKHFHPILEIYQQKGYIFWQDATVFLTRTGKLFADRIAEELFLIDNP